MMSDQAGESTQQQTRVLLINGQTIIVQGDITDQTISELNADILEQALNEAANNTVSEQNVNEATGSVPTTVVSTEQQVDNLDDPNQFIAIFETENGASQTVHLTYEQAAALGFAIPSEEAKKNEINSENHSSTNNAYQGTTGRGGSQQTTLLGSLLKSGNSAVGAVTPQYDQTIQYNIKLNDAQQVISARNTIPTVTPQIIKETNFINQQKLSITKSNTQEYKPAIASLRLKTDTSPAVLRKTPSKTIIPKIQATPTSMANLALSSAHPITSTASMVRVVPAPTMSTVKSTPVVTSTSSSAAVPVKTLDTSAVPRVATNAAKPLGSSENPIQLVQHGQTFHSMQPLSQDQLKQIATVLQQKQLDTSRNSKNVLYDATTNTRIIYRVVYPEDLALKKATTQNVPAVKAKPGTSAQKKIGRPPKSAATKKLQSEDDDDVSQDVDLVKDDKEEKKKAIPRTRSGRLSRPPRHMVKDYKRIHRLDFAEPDLDDSDGGYSDYQISDSELCADESSLVPIADNPDRINQKRAPHSRFRCPTCQKMYLGYRKLAGHFQAFPDHGSMDNIPKGPTKPVNGTDSVNGAVPKVTGRGIRTSKKRGLHLCISPAEKAERRKSKLRDILSGYTRSEIAEVCAPIVASSLDAWQFMQLKVADRGSDSSCFSAVVSEMQTLITTARSKVAEVIAGELSEDATTVHKVEINDTLAIAASTLNISSGIYNIPDEVDKKLEWKPITFEPLPLSALEPEPVAHSMEPLEKRQRMWGGKIMMSEQDKNFFDESEKPLDTSMGSDTPIDDIVQAELKKSGIEDYVPPPPVALPPGVGFTSTTFPTSQTHFPSDIVIGVPNVSSTGIPSVVSMDIPSSSHCISSVSNMDMSNVVSMNVPSSNINSITSMDMSSVTAAGMPLVSNINMPNVTSSVMPNVTPSLLMNLPNVNTNPSIMPNATSTVLTTSSGKLSQFHLASSNARLDLSTSIDVNLDSQIEAATQELDFEALSEEYNRSTQS